MRKVGDLDEAEDEEDEIKTVGSVEDEDIPAAKRAAMASAVALRAAAGGCELLFVVWCDVLSLDKHS
jgi:hypothetical protein